MASPLTYLNDDVKSVRVVLLDLLKLGRRVGPGELDVNICGIQLLGQLHLQSLRGSNDDMGSTVMAEELGEAETSRSGTEHQNRGTELGSNLLESMSSARGWLKESGIDVGEIVNLKDLSSRVGAVFGKTTVHLGQVSINSDMECVKGLPTGHSMSLELLAQQELSTAAVEALIAKFGVICTNTLANLEVLDILSNRSNDTNSLVTLKGNSQ